MAQVLGLPPWEQPIMILAVGYPDIAERRPYSQKFPLEYARHYNFERCADSISDTYREAVTRSERVERR